MPEEKVISNTRRWVADFVIGLNLCPFARKPFSTDKIRYLVYDGRNLEDLGMTIVQELLLLKSEPANKIETTLLIIPELLLDFYDYLDFSEVAERILASMELEGEIQIATFHPDYQFAEKEPQAVSHYTNRSPYPMLHLIREDSIEKATETYPNIEAVPTRNIQMLEDLGEEEVKRIAGLNTL